MTELRPEQRLFQAAEQGDEALVDQLIASDCNVAWQNEEGTSVLMVGMMLQNWLPVLH